MIELDRTLPEPQSLAAYRVANPQAGPSQFDHDKTFHPTKRQARERRNAEQGGLCVYCEQKLEPTDGHLEHIKPKGGANGHPQLTFDYGNLAHSCNGVVDSVPNRHCGWTKKDRVLHIEPSPGCNSAFDLLQDGEIRPDEKLPKPRRTELKYDLDILKLNLPTLKAERADWRRNYVALLRSNAVNAEQYRLLSPFRDILKQSHN